MQGNIQSKLYFLSAICGSCLTLAFAPFSNILALIIAISGFLYLIDYSAALFTQKYKVGFWIGFCFGYGHFFSSLYWISEALLVSEVDWLIPVALFLIPAVIAIFTGCTAVFTVHFLGNIEKWQITVLSGVIWTGFEIVRSYGILPFPWNLLGHTVYGHLALMQIIAFVGPHGASLLLYWLAGVAYYIQNRRAVLVCFVSLALLQFMGSLRIALSQAESCETMQIRVVQPCAKLNILDRGSAISSLQELVALSNFSTLSAEQISLVVWPESAMKFSMEKSLPAIDFLEQIIPRHSLLLTGIDRYDNKSKLFNSMIAVDNNGQIAGAYDKRTLVPFGEYIPFANFLNKILPQAIVGHGFSAGTRSTDRNDAILNLGLIPLICYESVLGQFYNRSAEYLEAAKIIINITNDGWFGDTIGPHQHLAMSVLKAVELGVPIARAANNGISVIATRHGEILEKLELNQVGNITAIVSIEESNNRTCSTCQIVPIMIASLLFLVLFCFKHDPKGTCVKLLPA